MGRVPLCGGPKNGEWIEWQGVEVHFPFIDTEHSAEHSVWFEKYGIIEIWSRLENVERWWPAPPSIPVWVYRAERGPYGVGIIGVYQGERR
jgi:hypothetical protein